MKKEYHYSQEERDELHDPASDWRQGKRGEECISACSLNVSDLIDKYGVRIDPPRISKKTKKTGRVFMDEEVLLARARAVGLTYDITSFSSSTSGTSTTL